MLYLSSYITLVKRILFLLLIYSLTRLGYYLYNLGWYADLGFFAIFSAFAKGVLFDLKTILYINLPFLVLSLLPFNIIFKDWYKKMLKVFFFITNLIPLCFNIADYEYSKYIGKRSDINIFGISQDIKRQFGQMALDFWYLALIGIFTVFLLWKFYPRQIRKGFRIKPLFTIPFFMVFTALVFLGLRGSVKLKPLLPVAAYSGSPEIANLMLNTPFCIIHTFGKEPLTILNYFTDEELDHFLQKPFIQSDTNRLGSNIVIVIVESLSPEFVGHLSDTLGYTPFIDSLAYQGISFKYCLSNGRTSQQAVPSILGGIPQLMDESIATSLYQTNRFYSLPVHLHQFGYNSYFFHGGNNGTMGFDKFTTKMGYQYFGANEYLDKKDHDGSWGIYDEPYLKYCAEMLDKLSKPFLSAIFTLSSHQPYSIPRDVKHLFKKGKDPAQNAIAYADYALKGFFREAEKYDWFNNTLFIITADHTHPPIERKFTGFLDEYRIPLIIYHPSMNFFVDTEKLVQQIDILPTIADFLGISPVALPKFGKSVFLKNEERNGIIYNHNSFYLVKSGYYLEMFDEEFKFKNWKDKPIPMPESASSDTIMIKAYRQYFNNSLVNNSFGR